jgi:phosphoglycolate phosphatase
MNNHQNNSNYTHIIWDFNGTLLNDVEMCMKTVNTLLTRRNMKTVDSIRDYHKVFCFPIIEYYKNLNFDFDKESYNDVAIEWVKEYLINTAKTPLYNGVVDVLSAIRDKDIPQIILSATEKQMLIKQVEGLGIKEYFDDILGLDNIHAHSKVGIAKQWKETMQPQKALFIGDTTHDYEVAQAIGVECALIANGHQSKETLQKCGVLVLNDVTEVLERLV